ncbi:hypothetical protein F5B22DRAFT_280933 [Xylaria bambusicola]|uniref:uncharacterized protein n=1 Tax=Xylaria bambusicola TaxID=326684 RepID=UPI00200890EF|nr:uncharacterized protein F5B22DRAFT_280933 [Xylaria bambusicola]KAI0512946.1 hypothetical protein F5B22DRAFT_280933 [Xylaria bambusicola]
MRYISSLETVASLIEARKRANRPSVENILRYRWAEELDKNIHSMWRLCENLVAERRRNPKLDARDLFNTIRFNVVTFSRLLIPLLGMQILIWCYELTAGHETTGVTLAFLFYLLLKNPETHHKTKQEVDRVRGDGVLKLH